MKTYEEQESGNVDLEADNQLGNTLEEDLSFLNNA